VAPTIPGPLHVYVAGEVVVVAITCTLVVKHVIVPVFAKIALGTPALGTTVAT
jgi:hypothetical protein